MPPIKQVFSTQPAVTHMERRKEATFFPQLVLDQLLASTNYPKSWL